MTPWELAIAALLYLNVARRYATQLGDYGMAAAFFFYAAANVGFIVSAMRMKPAG